MQSRLRTLFAGIVFTVTVAILATGGAHPVQARSLHLVDQPPLMSGLTALPQSGSLFFVSNRNGSQEIYRHDFPGGAVKQITNVGAGAMESFPSASPDGKQVCFESHRTGNFEIFCTDRDGNNPTNLTNDPGDDGMPRFSPDGTQIAYHRRAAGEANFQIWVMNADGSNKRQLTFENAYMGEPFWFPNGTKLVFDGDKPDRNLLMINLDGSGLTVINNKPGEQRRPSVSPDGMYIYYDSSESGVFQIYRMLFDGSNQTALTSSGQNFLPQVSPDGTLVAFMSTRDGGDQEIYLSNIDGSGQTRLTSSVGVDVLPSWANPLPVCAPETLTVPFVNGPNGVTSQKVYGVVDVGGGRIGGGVELPPGGGIGTPPVTADGGDPRTAAATPAATTLTLTVSGSGHAAGTASSDAFYIYTNAQGGAVTPQHYTVYYNWVLWINGQHVESLIPGGQVPAYRADHTYTFQVSVPTGRLSFGVGDIAVGDNSGSYTVAISGECDSVDTSNNDDLFGYGYELWTDPVAPRAVADLKLGLTVHRQGGKDPLQGVEVYFYDGDPSSGGKLIQANTIPMLEVLDASASTFASFSSIPTQGKHVLCAVIDPNNRVPEGIETNNTVCREVDVLAPAADMIAPRVDNFKINNGAASVSDRGVSLSVSVSDTPAPSTNVQAVFFVEYVYNQANVFWEPVQTSNWLAYSGTPSTYAWQLSAGSGMKFIQAWARDQAGNISRYPYKAYINLVLPSEQVELNGTRSYRYFLRQGEQLTARLEPVSGDPDLYIWTPNTNEPPYVSNLRTGVDARTFVAEQDGVYQVEVYGYSAASYNLTVTTPGSLASLVATEGGIDPTKSLRSRPVVAVASQPGDQFVMPDFTPVANNNNMVYLPLIVR
ncbi:DUF5050 domain-containing protein [Chloroflexales bacterium ZM16-3]|nr:DUF5050 domain-containing protein [Chloroflexales bacterium ZM16-3]